MTGPIGSCVYVVAKRCYECGTEWDGKAFTAQPANAPRLPGICAACIAKSDARMAELTHPIPERPAKDVELERPRSVRESDDEILLDRRRIASGEAA